MSAPGSTPTPSDAAVPLDEVAPDDAAPPPVSGSDQARLIAGVILEVLGGVRTPGEAAEILSVTTPRYYQLEARAVAGLIEACEPRARGPRIDHAAKCERQAGEIAGLKQEVGRLTALLRAAQQAYGVKPMPADRVRQAKAAKKAGKRAKRRPGVRALKARERLDGGASPPAGEGPPPAAG